MHTIFVSRDAVSQHICNGGKHETYAVILAGVCAHKAAEGVHLSVPLAQMPTVVSVLQDSVLHSLLRVHQTAVLFATIVQAVGLVAATVATLTAVVVFHTCTSCVIPETQDPVMYTNLLPLLLEFLPKTVE